MRKQLCLGMLAHVDAGKTTLNESFLYHGNIIRKMGRVDHKDAYMDYDSQERDRGITIYSKTAQLSWNDSDFTLVDTPGHLDFSSEMERTLQVLDYAILVINGQSGVQNHTETIWNLLNTYKLPAFIFVNKMDITVYSKEELLANLEKYFDNVIDFSLDKASLDEKIALCDETLLEEYMNNGFISDESISKAISKRLLYPVYFGTALKDQGVVELLNDLDKYTIEKTYPEQFGLKIFKIAYDETGTRLCYSKITGGTLYAKQKLSDEEKIDQIRLVSGRKYTLLQEAKAGMIVALKGLDGFVAGEGLGIEKNGKAPVLIPYMNYKVIIPKDCDMNKMLENLNMLQQEDPQIHINYESEVGEIQAELMGEIQIEIIKNLIKKRTGVDIDFVEGSVLFKETILDPVIGVGHFEPLRHYAEVHLRLEPLPANCGLVFESEVSSDDLSLNWQRLILTHLKEKNHKGVLTGKPITDMKITLIAGRAHLKHTEGGDFRQATYRAVRHGLKKAVSIVLEPFYDFNIIIQKQYLSKVLYDLENMNASFNINNDDIDYIEIKGVCAVRKMQNYHTSLLAATSGTGRLMTSLHGYLPSKDQQEIIDKFHYDSELDKYNPTGSVFCAHGAGFYVPYQYVEQYMHIKDEKSYEPTSQNASVHKGINISDAELKRVFESVNGRNKKDKSERHGIKRIDDKEKKSVDIKEKKPKLLIVDGYNIMHYFAKTRSIMATNFDGARDMIINDLSSYAGYRNYKVVVVFDAYKVNNSNARISTNSAISIVYSKTGQTADSYIEKLVHDYSKEYDLYVATSDAAVQNMVLGSGAQRISARELELELKQLNEQFNKNNK